ncbi:hypothetical protein F5Y00DRAFT_63477 [Daldinia vernicosa]|uniref:uncharacterized protein n=1 Tax=Daldinia vernicosa TaxID=114800 RepID=UPI002007C90B|nr:uncharacterized protein F5Y00DRAFT_63477 [Daldinia vernicosa]KAI0853966.1 hypothetical protein F5Y00DRAFT_63477 [Daldinia vernicosa]
MMMMGYYVCITALWLLINNLGYRVMETGTWDVSAWDGHENIYILPEGVVVDMIHRRTEAAGFLDRYNNTNIQIIIQCLFSSFPRPSLHPTLQLILADRLSWMRERGG